MSCVKNLKEHAKELHFSVQKMPQIYFYDVGEELQFPQGFFDVIISQVAIHYVGDKAKLYEEVWRVLKKDGQAFLHVDKDREGTQEPEFIRHKADTPLMIILEGQKIISTKNYLKIFRDKGFAIDLRKSCGKEGKKDQFILLMRKNTKKSLNLGLIYDDN
jgi:SAM-dependent methyltransferase